MPSVGAQLFRELASLPHHCHLTGLLRLSPCPVLSNQFEKGEDHINVRFSSSHSSPLQNNQICGLRYSGASENSNAIDGNKFALSEIWFQNMVWPTILAITWKLWYFSWGKRKQQTNQWRKLIEKYIMQNIWFFFQKSCSRKSWIHNSEQCHIQTNYTTGVHFKRKTHTFVNLSKTWGVHELIFIFFHKTRDLRSHGLEFFGWNVSLPEGGKKKAKQPVQLKSREIFPVTSMKPSMGTRSVEITRNGPWRILRQAALNWV